MKIGGQIPWNAIPICETLKISCLMGKLHTKGVLENLVWPPRNWNRNRVRAAT